MADLQRELNGYADYIGRYTGGQVKLSDSTILVPTIQIEDFINGRKTLSFDTTFTVVDQVAGLVVPDGKQWRVHFVSCYLSAQAAQAINYELHWRRVFGGATRYYPLGPTIPADVVAGQYTNNIGHTRGLAVYPNIIVPAGDGLGVAVSDLVGAGNFSTRFVCQVSEYSL